MYEELVEVMKGGLVVVKVKESRRGQPWFTNVIVNLRTVFHAAERYWLNCRDNELKREKQREYIRKRSTYKKAVSRAKRRLKEGRQLKLEKLIRSPKKLNGGQR